MTIKKLQDVVSAHYDLTFVGSGASTSYSIIELCEQFTNSDLKELRVLVIEASAEFHTGVAYGQRSGDKALILTRLDQFYQIEELTLFAKWIRRTDRQREIWGNEDQGYLDDLEVLPIAEYAARIGKKCIKRRLVGAFIAARVKRALASLPTNSGLNVDFVHATAHNISRIKELNKKSQLSVKLKVSSGEESIAGEITTSNIVLALGTRPRQALNVVGKTPSSLIPCIINDPYAGGGVDTNLQSMMRIIESKLTDEVRILVLGSNASAMETIYLLGKWSQDTGRRIQVVTVSLMGEFPSKTPDMIDDTNEPVPEIDEYITQGSISSDGFYAKVLDGLKRLRNQGHSIDYCNRSIDKALLGALKLIDVDTRLKFIREKGNALGRYKRRAEKHYHNTVEAMVISGNLKIISGHLKRVRTSQNEIIAEIEKTGYENTNVESEYLYADGIINCGASESLGEHSSNPLVASLVTSGLAELDTSKNCFKTVNGGFRVSNNIYLMGPLLSGNIVNNEPVWHLEHCGRIITFSKYLVSELLETLDIERELAEI